MLQALASMAVFGKRNLRAVTANRQKLAAAEFRDMILLCNAEVEFYANFTDTLFRIGDY